ncbi:LytTr DNA-binding region [Gemmatirosa kalamazoonensis]|uniref:LytTr DNA-binding region n=1 Tax=Gemmatirosa kalamazoonensis TaxID=861299 RepID=W0REA6_9BACT|nr:LytTR family DNA-binding domain-containing protein [Gemmatirosa kalamazoonensis]AHG88762.1 LytTr DNA-binding region [Gemmatirosa kalamazoonensis]
MTLRVLVADDEAPARRRLVRLLGAMGDVAVVGEAADGREAAERIDALAPDLVLLDVRMPIMDGFEVVGAVGVDHMPATVFVTAYDEHALRAFEVRALDYLLKPVAPARLREAVERARTRRAAPSALASLVAATAGRYLRRILVHDDRGAHLLPVDAIALARAERNYVVLHTARGAFRVRGTIGALAERLDPATFLRVNRSDVVRLDAIRELQPWSHGDYRIVLGDGSALLWSRRYRAQTAGAFELG